MRKELSPSTRRLDQVDEPLIRAEPYNYADAFKVRLADSDPRSAEDFARAALERSPAALRWMIILIHRHVLRFHTHPLTSATRVLGWQVVLTQPDVVQLTVAGPLMRAMLVGRRPEPSRAVLTTIIVFQRPALAHAIWRLVGPVHRRVAPYLLHRAATAVYRERAISERVRPSKDPLTTGRSRLPG